MFDVGLRLIQSGIAPSTPYFKLKRRGKGHIVLGSSPRQYVTSQNIARLPNPGAFYFKDRSVAKVAVLVDLSFFLMQYGKLRHPHGQPMNPEAVADIVWTTARAHLEKNVDELYRILVYDCKPLNKKAHNPISKKAVDFSQTETFKFRTSLHSELVCKRKVALRLGEIASRSRWVIKEAPAKALLDGKISVSELTETDVGYAIRQKGVDIKIGIDIASIAYKRLAERVVLITGDADFVPAAKLARREGLDVVLDPLWANISRSLNEHVDGLNTKWPKPTPPRDS